MKLLLGRDVCVVMSWWRRVSVEDRKDWLRGFKPGTHADYNVESVTYESFINKELILFSVSAAVMPLYATMLLVSCSCYVVSCLVGYHR